MKLGAFSVSLSVKDIHKSKSFYEESRISSFRRGYYPKLAYYEE